MNFSKHYFNLKGKNAEKLVHDLALKTFLTDWCYLNPELPSGKELCDLLVVFDEVAIELENPRRGKEQFDSTAIKEVYSISVLLGEGEEVFSFAEHVKNRTIHVFTRDFTQIALNELDTISDFIKYLRTKEALIGENKQFIILGGEEELLAHYLMNNRSFEEFKKADLIILEQGSWEQIQNREEYKAKKKEDEISYLWDSIINRAHEGSVEYERVARELARPNRFERRYLSKTYLDAQMRADENGKYDLFRRILPMDGVTYCFLFAAQEPREMRVAMLSAICWIARGTFHKNIKVIGIASEKKVRPARSYDFCLMNIPEWTKENQRNMEQLQQETRIFVDPIVSYAHEDEYPKLAKD